MSASGLRAGFDVNAKAVALIYAGTVTLTTPAELEAFISRTSVNGLGVIRVRALWEILQQWKRDEADAA